MSGASGSGPSNPYAKQYNTTAADPSKKLLNRTEQLEEILEEAASAKLNKNTAKKNVLPAEVKANDSHLEDLNDSDLDYQEAPLENETMENLQHRLEALQTEMNRMNEQEGD